MKIIIPPNNINERKYIIDILLGEFLGLNFKLIIDNGELKINDWIIELENNNKLIIEDHFFNKFPKELQYLKEENIPEKVEFTKNDFIVENNIPIIYGNFQFSISNSQFIKCGIDIFASSFFMLTRWEEYVNKTRDTHNRFPAYASLTFKNNFLDRPAVNEYVEMLWNMLKFLGCKQERKKGKFKYILTHDVDVAFKYGRIIDGNKEILGDIIKRKNIYLALNNIKDKLKVHLKLTKDPFDTYDYLMDISENLGVKSYFFLHSSNNAKQDINNDIFLKKISNKITKRGHFIGYHPSYNAYNNYELFLKDKEKIENIIGQKLTFGRAHFLRFEIPTTWEILEEAKMQWDSSLSYADKEGFRCGVCYEFSVFNILTRKKLKLREKPLIVMDGSFGTYQSDIKMEDMQRKIDNLIEKVKQYKGEFVFLWHNSSFNTLKWKKYKSIYKKALIK